MENFDPLESSIIDNMLELFNTGVEDINQTHNHSIQDTETDQNNAVADDNSQRHNKMMTNCSAHTMPHIEMSSSTQLAATMSDISQMTIPDSTQPTQFVISMQQETPSVTSTTPMMFKHELTPSVTSTPTPHLRHSTVDMHQSAMLTHEPTQSVTSTPELTSPATSMPQLATSTSQLTPSVTKKPSLSATYRYQHLIDAMDVDASVTDDKYVIDSPKTPVHVDRQATGSDSMQQRRSVGNGRPPYSYIALICMAISSSTTKQANLREIVHYIERHFPYYRSDKRWHGVLRHHLSINDCFVKLPRRNGEKLCQWMINAEHSDMFENGSLLRRRSRSKVNNHVTRRKKISADAKGGQVRYDVKLDPCNLDSIISKITSSPAIQDKHEHQLITHVSPRLSPISTIPKNYEHLAPSHGTPWHYATPRRSDSLSSGDNSGSDVSADSINTTAHETPVFHDVTNDGSLAECTDSELLNACDISSLAEFLTNYEIHEDFENMLWWILIHKPVHGLTAFIIHFNAFNLWVIILPM